MKEQPQDVQVENAKEIEETTLNESPDKRADAENIPPRRKISEIDLTEPFVGQAAQQYAIDQLWIVTKTQGEMIKSLLERMEKIPQDAAMRESIFWMTVFAATIGSALYLHVRS